MFDPNEYLSGVAEFDPNAYLDERETYLQDEELSPQESVDRSGVALDIAIDQEMPIADVEENINEFEAWNNGELFDPSEPPQVNIMQGFDIEPDIQPDNRNSLPQD